MAKPKKTAAKKPPSTKPKRTKPDKPTVEALSDQQRQSLLFSHKRKLKPLLEAERLAKAAVSKAYELAKKEGVPKDDLKLVIQLESEEGEKKFQDQITRGLTVARWAGAKLGSQLEMFGPKLKRDEEIFEAGKRAALDEQPRKPPSHYGQKDAQHWMEGYDQGRTTLNMERAASFRPIGAVVDSLLPPTEPLPAPPPAANGNTEPAEATAH